MARGGGAVCWGVPATGAMLRPMHRETLPNGLTWIHLEQPGAPVAAVQVWIKAGAGEELPHEEGLAHLHEHMLFKGTQRRGPGAVAQEIEAHGGEINAWTSHDTTAYHATLAAPFFERAVDVLADAVRHSTFDAEELAREIEVVVEEIQRAEDTPSRHRSRAVLGLAFEGHPYARQVLGTAESVRGHDRNKVLAFFHRQYRPENAVVTTVGGIDRERAAQAVHQHFGGDWQRPEKVPQPPTRPAPKAWPGLRGAVVHRDVKEAQLSLAFAGPALAHADTPALDVLAWVLGQGESCRLEQHVRRPGIVTAASASAWTPRNAGLFSVDALLSTDRVVEATGALLSQLLRLRDEEVEPAELAAAQIQIEASAVQSRETAQGMARRLAFFQTELAGPEAEFEYLRAVAALTPAHLREVAQRWFDPERAIACALVPMGTVLDPTELEEAMRATKPAPGRSHAPRAPEVPFVAGLRPFTRGEATRPARTELKLAHGATLLLQPEPGSGSVSLRLAIPGGIRFESEADAGLHQLLARCWTTGTPQHDAQALARSFDAIAMQLDASAGRSSLGLRAQIPTPYLERGLALFEEVLRSPRFDEAELERERTRQLQRLRTREERPSGLAFRIAQQELFKGHPYRLDLEGELESVTQLSAAQLRASHLLRLGAPGRVLAAAGDFDPAVLGPRLAALLDSLPRTADPLPFAPAIVPPTAAVQRHHVLARAQSHVVLAWPGLALHDPRRTALEVLTTLLGGQGGRLFLDLRDKRSLAYSLGASSLEAPEGGYVALHVGTQSAKVGAALSGLREHLELLRNEPVTAQEIERAQRHLIGSAAIALQRAASRAATLALDTHLGLGADHHEHFAERVEAVGPAELQALARALFVPEREVQVVVGPA